MRDFVLAEKENKDEILFALNGIEKELKGIKRKGAKQVFQIVVSVVLSLIIGITAGAVCGRNWNDIKFNLFPNKYSQSTTKILEEKLTKQAKLNTALYEQTSEYESEKLFDNKIQEKLHLSKSMKFTYTGYVEAGVQDLSTIKINVNSKTNTVTVSNIKIEITNAYVDTSSIVKTEQTKNIFNQLTVDDFANCLNQLQQKLKDDATSAGVVELAKESCEETLNNLFGDALNGYTVVYEWTE